MQPRATQAAIVPETQIATAAMTDQIRGKRPAKKLDIGIW